MFIAAAARLFTPQHTDGDVRLMVVGIGLIVLGFLLFGGSLLVLQWIKKQYCTNLQKAIEATRDRLYVLSQNRECFTLKGLKDDDTYYYWWIEQESGQRYLALCVDAYTREDTEKEDFVLPIDRVVIGTPEEVKSHWPTHCVSMRGPYLERCIDFDPSIQDQIQALRKEIIIFLGLALGIGVPTTEH